MNSSGASVMARNRPAVAAVVLVAEGDAALIEADEAAVRDGDAVGVAGEIGEHRFGPGGGRWLDVEEPFLPPERGKMLAKACRRRKPSSSPNNASRPAAWASARPVRKSRRNRRERTRPGKK